ncbi:glycerophosphodiester phosphodiesterase family protein [Falsirhodobacter sp. 20TX0035]|uniref:glycerophosphodiester phosphodiesterase family protein n=1 Tax=Falsirhodobacter sp. 20TX0035 TaxID=3022019 RepID=UPI00232F5AAD|nr:glycerophosphodiester phosphodiesterase family protein [Falsirhodobacter sp. 20TX0035]MDB6452997.1 glycerophosphodiester phosphodiesterase family protein [Falsirhodobacter sp. 20TX0035]
MKALLASIGAAIQRARDVRADIVEVDVRQSADGVLFLCHDETLERMAGVGRPAESFTMSELKKFSLREDNGGEGRATTAEQIPTLDEALDLIRGNIFADLDLKDRGLFPQVAEAARRMGAQDYVDLKTEVAIRADLDWVAAQKIDGIAFMAMTRFTSDTVEERLALLSTIRPFMAEIRFDDLNTIAANRDRFEAANLSLWKNTLDPANSGEWNDEAALKDPDAIWGTLIRAGISCIQTDEPEALRAWLEGRKA